MHSLREILSREMRYIPLFRQSINIVNGVYISNDQALPDSVLQSWMITFGSITGMELPTSLYTFCRGNGKAFDNSSKYHNCYRFSSKLSTNNWKGFITKLQRNLILQHYNSTVFLKSYLSRYITSNTQVLKSYLSRYITSNTQAARRVLKLQTALMWIASGMSCTINC